MKTKTLDEQIKIIRWNDNGEKTIRVELNGETKSFSDGEELKTFLSTVELELNDFWKPIYEAEVETAVKFIG